jgi:tetratricopeptide (TPR) repeat protein
MSDIFALQDDIASSVALAMQLTLAGEADQGGRQIETVGTRNVAAYDKYLQGMQQMNLGHTASLLLAEILFREALALDPYYHEARLQLADSYLRQLDWGVITATEANAHVNPLLDRLLEEWPDGGRALAPMYAARLILEGFMDLDSASMDIEKQLVGLATAIDRTPNETELYIALAALLKITHRTTEALQWLDRGIALDPLNKRLHLYRGFYLADVGDLDGAEAAQARVIEIDPYAGAIIASDIAWHNQQYAEWTAIIYSLVGDPLDYETPVFFAMNHYLLGLIDEGDKYLQRATLIAPDMAVVRATKLYQLILQGDHSRARELSETMLRDDIDNRRGAYKFALMAFLSAMSELDKLDEALTILEELRPGVSSPDFDPQTFKDQVLQYHAVLALAQRQSHQENLNMLDAIVPSWDESFPFWRNHPGIVAPITMARGQTNSAVELMLGDLDVGLAEFNQFDRQLPYQHISYYKALTFESPIAARLKELNEEAKKVGEQVWTYIVENQLQL